MVGSPRDQCVTNVSERKASAQVAYELDHYQAQHNPTTNNCGEVEPNMRFQPFLLFWYHFPRSNMLAILFVLGGVAGLLALEVHLILF